jgi:hypothetical protein
LPVPTCGAWSTAGCANTVAEITRWTLWAVRAAGLDNSGVTVPDVEAFCARNPGLP